MNNEEISIHKPNNNYIMTLCTYAHIYMGKDLHIFTYQHTHISIYIMMKIIIVLVRKGYPSIFCYVRRYHVAMY